MVKDAAVVKLRTAPNEALAAMWSELLRAEGIPVMVKLAGPGIAYFSPALCEHVVYVRAGDAGRAAQLLDDYAAEPDEVQEAQIER